MADEPKDAAPTLRVLPFQRPVLPPPPSSPPGEPDKPAIAQHRANKFGLYPLGVEDVVVSLQVFITIVGLLESGAPEERAQFAKHMRDAYDAYFA